MSDINLPPGQRAIDFFPRFGLIKYARRFRREFEPLTITICGDVQHKVILNAEDLSILPRVQQRSDFHCVTTWTKCDLDWSGYRFSDFYQSLVQVKAKPLDNVQWVIFRCQDGFRAILPLTDLMSNDVLLADTLQETALSAKHGAPLRLVAPAHYGFKNVKHLKAIEFYLQKNNYKPPAFRFMDHPRGRVALEERGQGVPAWLLRLIYRPFVKPIMHLFKRAMQEKHKH